jgi:hypothetical protein
MLVNYVVCDLGKRFALGRVHPGIIPLEFKHLAHEFVALRLLFLVATLGFSADP